MTGTEQRDIVAMSCWVTIGWHARTADIAVCLAMAGPEPTVERLVEVTSEYIWDHLAGEPEHFSAEDVARVIRDNIAKYHPNVK